MTSRSLEFAGQSSPADGLEVASETLFSSNKAEAREMAQQLEAQTVLLEEPSSVAGTSQVVHTCL